MQPPEPNERLISFIVPALNAAATLGACLDAILRARPAGSSRQVLLIDNGSTDQTAEIARQRGIRVISAPGLTVAAMRNLGARLAEGHLLAFVDADCVIAPDWIEKGLANFADPDVGAVGSPTHVRDRATWVETTWALHRHRENRRRRVEWLPTENLLIRRTAFHESGGFNDALITCEDVDLCYRVGVRCRIVNDPETRCIHLGEAQTLMGFFKKEAWRGRGNLSGFFSHRLRLSELPSVLLPLHHGLWALVFLGAMGYWVASGSWLPALVAATMLLLPPSILALHTGVRTRQIRCFPQLMSLYMAYAAARSTAMLASALPSSLLTRRGARASCLPAKAGRSELLDETIPARPSKAR